MSTLKGGKSGLYLSSSLKKKSPNNPLFPEIKKEVIC